MMGLRSKVVQHCNNLCSDLRITKGIFIRELYEAWSRTSKDSDVAKLIQSYVMVQVLSSSSHCHSVLKVDSRNSQFNALLELAKAPDNDYFSPLWHGPADPKLIPQGQLSALDVFNAAAGMANVEAQPRLVIT